METKEQLVNNIKEWIKIDNEIGQLKNDIKEKNKKKKELTTNLVTVMKTNEIDCFDINDGQICYTKKNVKKPITKKVLMNILSNFYNGDIAKANQLNNYIIENQEEVVKETIERKITTK